MVSLSARSVGGNVRVLVDLGEGQFVLLLKRIVVADADLGVVADAFRSASSHLSLVCVEFESWFGVRVFATEGPNVVKLNDT